LGDQLVIMETLGYHLASQPYLSSVVLAGGLLQRIAQGDSQGPSGGLAQQRLTQLIAGETLLAVAMTEPQARHDLHDVHTTLLPGPVAAGSWRLQGRKAVVHGAPWASELIVLARSSGSPRDPEGLSLVCLPMATPGLRRRDTRTVDGHWSSEIALNDISVTADQLLGPLGQAGPVLAQAVDDATLAVCAEACGVMRRLMRDTLQHARERKQFGVPIASFQVLQHRMADMHMALEQAGAVTAWAAEQSGAAPALRAQAISSAKVTVSRACRTVGQGAVQIHGGMGMTEELAVGHFFRRATQIEQLFGPVNHHLHRVESLLAQAL
jgi:alkylation response protein AidB-like acyl-CoA dehydrogenase